MDVAIEFASYIWSVLYQNIIITLLFTILALFAIAYISENGLMHSIKKIWHKFKTDDNSYRWKVLFFLYTFFLARITLLGREYFATPLSRVFDKGWLITKNEAGEWDFDAINNILLLMPYTFSMFRAFPKLIIKSNAIKAIFKAFLISLCTTLFIENCQLIFSIGTFQLADMTYNTIGGILGGLIAYIFVKYIKNKASIQQSV